MNIYQHKTIWKFLLILTAVMIGFASLLYTNILVKDLKREERKKVELWAEATRQIISSADSCQNLDFLLMTIESNSTVPVIWTDENDIIIGANNFDSVRTRDPRFLQNRLAKMKEKCIPIIINLPDNSKQKVFYEDSIILKQLTFYPYIQLSVIMLFIAVSYMAFSSSRRAEQNQVWVGMSKETAHQLGTPTSSLAGWLEIIRMKYPEMELTEEIAKDVSRLERVTERFSKIGARPELVMSDAVAIVYQTVDYLRSRSSSKISFSIEPAPDRNIYISANGALLGWVIENVCKNAIDATEGSGKIAITISDLTGHAAIDITDNGKGIPKSSFRKIFQPGYTTKARGWGLGLSLSRRIIEDYHGGKIFVRFSEPGDGTCIRILLKKY